MTEGIGTHVILWRRLDTPGHDACRLIRGEDGWRLEGAAAFQKSGVPAELTYRIDCDVRWETRSVVVGGWIGSSTMDVVITRPAGGEWIVNGRTVIGLGHCMDLDLGFTPATNLVQIRRVALDVGEIAEVPVAWLDAGSDRLEVLDQRYERRTDRAYGYEAPRFDVATELRINSVGFVEQYPGLWRREG